MTFLAPDEFPSDIRMFGLEEEENPVQDLDDERWSVLDWQGSSASFCTRVGGIESLDDLPAPIGWRAVSHGQPGFMSDGPLEGALPVLAVMQGVTTPDDAASVIAARRSEITACAPPSTLRHPYNDAFQPVVQLETPDIGDEAVAWRSVLVMPEAFPIVYDMVWWRRGQDLGAVVVTWIPASRGRAAVDAERNTGSTDVGDRGRRRARRRGTGRDRDVARRTARQPVIQEITGPS